MLVVPVINWAKGCIAQQYGPVVCAFLHDMQERVSAAFHRVGVSRETGVFFSSVLEQFFLKQWLSWHVEEVTEDLVQSMCRIPATERQPWVECLLAFLQTNRALAEQVSVEYAFRAFSLEQQWSVVEGMRVMQIFTSLGLSDKVWVDAFCLFGKKLHEKNFSSHTIIVYFQQAARKIIGKPSIFLFFCLLSSASRCRWKQEAREVLLELFVEEWLCEEIEPSVSTDAVCQEWENLKSFTGVSVVLQNYLRSLKRNTKGLLAVKV